MKLTTRHDIEAPIAYVHAQFADFEMWERAAMRRGADVQRDDPAREARPGTWWDVRFRFRGRDRQARVTLLRHDPGQHFAFDGEGPSARAGMTIDLVELGPKRTRVVASAQIAPKTLAARLFVQAMKLARRRVQRRFDGRMARFAAEMEERYRSRPKR